MAGSVIASSSSGKEATKTTALVGEIDKNIKYKTIEPFSGERNKLQGFLLQLRLYVKFNGDRFRSETEQVLWAVTLLEGKAMNWIEGFLDDYLNLTNAKGGINHDKMEDTTIRIFETWDGFVSEIKANFGVTDERREAERAIESLRQKGSATSYTRDFQRYSTKTEWGDEALRYQYRKGLKDFVKDELLRTGQKTDTLETLIAAACEIDNAWYERGMEKKGKYDPDYRRMGEGRYKNSHRNGRRYDRGDPMELDATDRREFNPQERQKYMDKKLCFNCGKPGHMARNCKSGRSQRPNRGRGELNVATRGRGGYEVTDLPGLHGKMQNKLYGKDQRPKGWDQTMQLNATFAKPLDNGEGSSTQRRDSHGDDSDAEIVNRSLAAVNLEENNDDIENESDSSEYSSSPSEITETEYRTAQILAGAETAQKYFLESQSEHFIARGKLETQYKDYEEDSRKLISYYQHKLDIMADYRFSLMMLDGAITRQIAEQSEADKRGIRRSQQYCDYLVANMEFQERGLLKARAEQTRLRHFVEEEFENLRKRENVAETDHPRHNELAWSFCYTDGCTTHSSAKRGAGYWPSKKVPVYWGKPTISTTAPKTAEQSKN